jgi:hypothetical protein
MRFGWVTGWAIGLGACSSDDGGTSTGGATDEGDADTDADSDTDTDTDVDTDAEPSTVVLFINEFMASNTATLQDESGAFPDWLEIHNPGSAEVDLSGFGLSDDAAEPMKWTFAPGSRIAAGEFLVMYADKDAEDGPKHLSFNLDADGEDLVLSDAEGRLINQILSYAPQTSDVSLARVPDDGPDWINDPTPTPGATNQ